MGIWRTQVVDDLFAYMNVIGDYIYSDGHGERYARIKNDGTDKKTLCEK